MINVRFDRAYFPMVRVESIDAFLHWIPVTKVQFEYFLWDSISHGLDQAWLERMYKLNPRITPAKIARNNYWRIFMTGIAPFEADRFAGWCGDDTDETGLYGLPTAEEWQRAIKELQSRNCLSSEELIHAQAPDRIKTLLLKLTTAAPQAPRTLADQMFFNGGVLEWVQHQGERVGDPGYVAHGCLNPGWGDNVIHTNHLSRPLPVKSVPGSPDDNKGRYAHYGFRLLRREENQI